MSRYLNTVYGTDTYGIRIRSEIPIKATCVDYGRIRVDFGPVPEADFPTGTRVVISRSTFYWPRPPLAKGTTEGGVGTIIDPDEFNTEAGTDYSDISYLPAGSFSSPFGNPFQLNSDDTVFYGGTVGYDTIPAALWDSVPGDSVVYYRVYVTEPMMIDDSVDIPPVFQDHLDYLISSGQVPEETDIDGMWSPWEVRGQAYAVSVGRHGGEEFAIDAFPNGIMTGGDVYGVPDTTSTHYQFCATLGWLSDIVATDGLLISDRPELSHPNMVKPLLEAFGLLEDEDTAINAQFATWNREFESPRMKALSYAYRDLTLRKGTQDAVGDYMWLAYGLKSARLTQPENMVLTVTDASPREYFDESVVTLDLGAGEQSYYVCPELHVLPNSSVSVRGGVWSRQPVFDANAHLHGAWCDVMSAGWNAGPQDSLFVAESGEGDPGYIGPVVGEPGSADTWAIPENEAPFYDQFTDFVYQIEVPANGSVAAFGSVTKSVWEPDYSGVTPVVEIVQKPDFQYSIPIESGVNKYWVRCRVMRQVGEVAAANIVADWLDSQGNHISRERFPVDSDVIDDLNADREWHELSNAESDIYGRPPPSARYMAWSVEFRTGDEDDERAVVCVGAAHISWLDLDEYPVYRNPRSVVALVDWTDEYVTIDQRIALEKTRTALRDRIPANVDYRILTSESADEFLDVAAGPALAEESPFVGFADTRVEFGGDWRDDEGDPTGNDDITFDQRDFPTE